jgi:hypothetical protein
VVTIVSLLTVTVRALQLFRTLSRARQRPGNSGRLYRSALNERGEQSAENPEDGQILPLSE